MARDDTARDKSFRPFIGDPEKPYGKSDLEYVKELMAAGATQEEIALIAGRAMEGTRAQQEGIGMRLQRGLGEYNQLNGDFDLEAFNSQLDSLLGSAAQQPEAPVDYQQNYDQALANYQQLQQEQYAQQGDPLNEWAPGDIYSIEGMREAAPERYQDTSDEQIVMQYANATGMDPFEVARFLGVKTGQDKGDFSAGLSAGGDMIQGLGLGAAAGLSDLVGADETAEYLREQMDDQAYQGYLAGKPELERVEDIDSVGAAVDWAQYQLGKQGPTIATLIGAQAIPGLGQAATASGAARLAAMAPRVMGGGGLRAGATAIERKIAMRQGQALAKSTMAGTGLGYGSLYQASGEDGEYDPGLALLGAVPYGLAEAAVPASIQGLIRAPARAGTSASRIARTLGSTSKAAVSEAATEAAQTSMEIAIDGTMTPEEIQSQYLNAVAAGGVVGGAMGGVGGVLSRGPAKPEPVIEETVLGEKDLAAGTTEPAEPPSAPPASPSAPSLQDQARAMDKRLAAINQFDYDNSQIKARVDELEAQRNAGSGFSNAVERRLQSELARLEQQYEVVGKNTKPKKVKGQNKRGRQLAEQRLEQNRQALQRRIDQTRATLDRISASRTAREELGNLQAALTGITVRNGVPYATQPIPYEAWETLSTLDPQLTAAIEASTKDLEIVGGPEQQGQQYDPEGAEAVAQATQQDEASMVEEVGLGEGVDLAPVGESDAVITEEKADSPVEAPKEKVTDEPVEDSPELRAQLEALEEKTGEDMTSPQRVRELKKAIAEANKLDAEVETDRKGASSRVTLPDQVLLGIATMLRNPDELSQPIVWKGDGTAAVDKEATTAYAAKMQMIVSAAEQLAKVAKQFNDAQNIFGGFGKQPSPKDRKDAETFLAGYSKQFKAADVAEIAARRKLSEAKQIAGKKGEQAVREAEQELGEALATKDQLRAKHKSATATTAPPKFRPKLGSSEQNAAFQEAQRNLSEATRNFVNAAGGPGNARAVIAALKVRGESQRSAQIDRVRFARRAEMFGKGKIDSKLGYTEFLDSQISNAVARYLDGTLDNYDYVSPIATRDNYREQGQKNRKSKLERLYEQSGAAGVLRYIASWQGTASGYQQVLGSALRAAISNMESAGVPIKIVFTTEKKSYYDPNQDGGTIFLSREASPEVTMHEMLHAALQWFVYSNQTDANVIELQNAVNDVIDYVDRGELDNLTTLSAQYKAEAKAVVEVLRKLRDGGTPLDAVLELVSYTATLNSFRQLTKAIKSQPSEAVKGWLVVVDKIWRHAVSIVRMLTGGFNTTSETAASTILGNTFALLQKVSDAETVTPVSGNTLYHALGSTEFMENDEAPRRSDGTIQNDRLRTAADRHRDDWRLGTRFFFKLIGWDKLMGTENARGEVEGGWLQDKLADLGNNIRTKHPSLTKFITWFNAMFTQTPAVRELLQLFKRDRAAGFMYVDNLITHMERKIHDTAYMRAIVAYMDKNDSAKLLEYPGGQKWVEMIDEAKNLLATYAMALPEKDRQYFMDQDPTSGEWTLRDNFTDMMIDVSNVKAVSSHKFGLRKIGDQIRAATIGLSVSDVDSLREAEFIDTADGTPVTDAEYFRIEVNREGEGLPNYSLFISTDKYHAIDGDLAAHYAFGNSPWRVDTKALYRFGGKMKGQYRFAPKKTFEDASDLRNAQSLIFAMRNTFGGLANYYASKNFIDNLVATQGTEGTLMFDDVAELNEYFGKSPVDADAWTEEHLKFADAITSKQFGKANWRARAPGTFVRVPGNSEDGTTWGVLSGKIIPGELWVAINDAADRNPLVNFAAYNNALQFWKKTKTVYNPGTQITNVAANITLMMFHGIPLRTAVDAASLLYKFEARPDSLSVEDRMLVKQFVLSGAQIGNFSNTELKQIIADSSTEAMSPIREDSLLTKAAQQMRYQGLLKEKVAENLKAKGLRGKELAKRLDEWMVEAYNMGDNIFRFAAFMTRAGTLANERNEDTPSDRTLVDAGIYAKNAFIDYDIDAKAVKAMRQSFMPFVSYTYGIVPVLARLIATKPWLIANTMIVMSLIDFALAGLSGDDDDEIRKLGPDGMQDQMFGFGPRMHWRMPFFGDSDNPVYMRVGDYVPLASSVRGGLPNQFMGQDWWPQGMTPSNPFLSIFTYAVGYDPFTGKRIWDGANTGADNALETAKRAASTFLPPAASHYNWERAKDLMDGTVGPTGKSPSAAFFLFGKIAGFKLENYNLAEEQYYRQLRGSQVFRDYKSAIAKARREEFRKGYPDYEALNTEVMGLYERMLEEYNDVMKFEEE